jgi:hypothetical protein
MPFKSEKQRRWMWANEPEMAEKWAEEEDKNEGRTMKITRRHLRKIISKTLIKENGGVFIAARGCSPMKSRADPAFAAAIKGTPLNIEEAYSPEVARVDLSSGPVSAKWTADGLSMQLLTPGGKPMVFDTKSDVQALINMLEQLLAGAMRTSP